MKKYDAIIIGGGLGGLVAGAKLAKEGKKVVLLEQHNIPGGCATNFKRLGSKMDVGLHEIGSFSKGSTQTVIFKDLKINENIDFVELPEFYRFTNGRLDIVIPDNREEAEKILIQKLPEEKKGIENFFKEIMGFYDELQRMPRGGLKFLLQLPIFPFLYPHFIFSRNKTVGEFMDKIIKNNDLKLALTANIGYYHDSVETMAYSYFAIAQGGYYSGGYYIKGGSQNLSNYLTKLIKDNGGEVLLSHKVIKILTENNRAIGVEYKNIFGSGESENFFSQYVIANAAIPNVANDLLSEEAGEKLKLKINKMEVACSLLNIYLFFKKPVREIGNKHYSTFVFDQSVQNLHDLNYHINFEKRGFVFVDYSQVDSQLAAPGKGVGVICTVDYLKDWEELNADEYKDKKEAAAQIYIEKLEKLIPGIKEQIEYYEVGTPKTTKRYTSNPQGTPYGFAQIPSQALIKRISQKSSIENLYFASAWTMPGGGFTGAIFSGYFCAEEILNKKQ
jgi:all-trans-retinol 13,14-reductase